MANSVVITGGIVRAETKVFDNGIVVNGTIGKNKRVKRGENWEEVSLYFPFKLSLSKESKLPQYLTPGTQVSLQGELDQETWTAADGSKRSKTVIRVGGRGVELLGSPKKGDSEGTPSTPAPENTSGDTPEVDIDEDEIPF